MAFDGAFPWTAVITATYVVGIIFALNAVQGSRTAQGAIAWSLSLVTVPYIAIPFYLVFGPRKFLGYIKAQRAIKASRDQRVKPILQSLGPRKVSLEGDDTRSQIVFENLAELPFTTNNDVTLLVDGERSFDAIFSAIDQARDYILLEYYIVQDDVLGGELKERLKERASKGVRVLFLFDEIGSFSLSESYIEDLRRHGVQIYPFGALRKHKNRFQINFRNHRKMVVVDGRLAFVGGHNIGDTYRGKDKYLGYWRDTHLSVRGPAVQGIQLSFLGDWFWATREVPELSWTPDDAHTSEMSVLPLATGPADERESCVLFFLHAINSAKERCWIASPYFVPDEAISHALRLAALRGVDTRVLIPEKADHKLVHLAAFSFVREMIDSGVKMYRYKTGFLHQKVMLIDDRFASIGTANLDNRSLRLNFELSIIVWDVSFAEQVGQMLERDFEGSAQMNLADYDARSLAFRVAANAARLFSPLL